MAFKQYSSVYFGIFLLFSCSIASCNGGYILTFPQQLQTGAEERFCLTLYNVSQNINININISCYGVQVSRSPDTFYLGASRCFQWQIPDTLAAGTCDLDLQGHDDHDLYTFSESRKVEVVDNHKITFIQTDKPVYKPGETVKFRILTVTQELLPLQSNVESVVLLDPSGIFMKQWLDFPVKQGLLSLEYRLYNEPVLGDWKIVAVVNGRKTEQAFTILEYVLPKFQVYSKLPAGLTVATKSINFEVCAKYTFGKRVEGRLNATVCLHNTQKSWFCETIHRPCVNVVAQVNGCHSFNIATKLLNITERRFSLLCEPRLRLNTTVTETQTGVEVKDSQDGPGVWEERLKLKILAHKFFKPHLPYVAKVFARHPDGSPAVDEEIQLTIGKLGISTRLVTDHTGHAHFTLQKLTQSTPYFVVEVKTLDEEQTDNQFYTIYPAKARKHVKQWYSPTSTYVQLTTSTTGQATVGGQGTVDRGMTSQGATGQGATGQGTTGQGTVSQGPERQCGDNLNITVAYSRIPGTTIQSVIYQLMSKGNILKSEDITEKLRSNSQPFVEETQGPTLIPKTLVDSTEPIYDDANVALPGPPRFDSKDFGFPEGPQAESSEWSFDGAPAAGPPAPFRGKDSRPIVGPPQPPGFISGDAGEVQPGASMPEVESADVEYLDMDSNSGIVSTADGMDTGTQKIVPPEIQQFTIHQALSQLMAPKVRVLVYVVTTDGEIAADSIDLDIQHCHRNKVQMSFDNGVVRPGAKVNMTLSATPHSLCATMSVDKSIFLVGTSTSGTDRLQGRQINLLQEADVNDRLGEYDLTSDFINDWQYCSDMSQLPPDLSNSGPPHMPGAPGYRDDTNMMYAPGGRKKRSIMQYHSNMYDSLLAFKMAGLTVLTDLDLLTRPCLHGSDILGPPHIPGDPTGPIPGQPGDLQDLEPAEEPIDEEMIVSSVRRYFPETWLWRLSEIPASGSMTITETPPDTITEWLGNSVCISEHTGLGISDVAKVTTFKPFFVSVKLPYAVIQGELVNVPVVVYNYLPHCIALQVHLVNNGRFQLEGDTETKQTCICQEQTKGFTFKIRPTALGKQKLTFSAFLREHRVNCRRLEAPAGYENNQVTEFVIRKLLVQAEGIQQEHTSSKFICPADVGGVYNTTLSLKPPSDVLLVPGSLKGWINVIGDIMGPVLSDLDQLILLPMGCGEQNMIRLAPNVAILKYLTRTGQLTDHIEVKTLDHLNKGFQQQLKFMHSDGSYSAFGAADEAGSTWLTAFVFKTLRQALQYIYIDRKGIQTRTWEFLLHQQGEDGCFHENGKTLSKYMMGGVSGSHSDKKRALTAYVLVAMLESFRTMKDRTPPFVALAVRCIQVDNFTDTYTHALVAYAMALYKPRSPFTDMIINTLKEKAQKKDGMLYWKREKQPEILEGQGRAPSAEIEMTSYALLAILTRDQAAPITEMIPIVRWLTSQRNAYGGFASTQDTVVAMQALSLFAKRIYGHALNVSVVINSNHGNNNNGFHGNQGVVKQLHVLPSNSIELQQHELTNPSRDVLVTARGEGCVMLQWTSRYNIYNRVLLEDDPFKLVVTTPVTMEMVDTECRQRSINICVSYHGNDGVSNMAVVEVKIPSGWIADVTSLQNLLNSVAIPLKKYEMDENKADTVNFYFDKVDDDQVCFDFTIFVEVAIEDPQPSMATVFDYYETGEQTSAFYTLTPCDSASIGRNTVDVSIDKQTDIRTRQQNTMPIEDNLVHAQKQPLLDEPQSGSADNNDITNVAAPDKSSIARQQASDVGDTSISNKQDKHLQCPRCYVTGTVDILQDICYKQVWLLKRSMETLQLQVLSSEGISPQLDVPAPTFIKHCNTCRQMLATKDSSSIALVLHSEQQKIGEKLSEIGELLGQDTTVVIPNSPSLQVALQHIIKTCATRKDLN